MELNEEAVKKSLDWLDSLVGNSNDSDIALLTYQLLGILYDTCEELTEEKERLEAYAEKNDSEWREIYADSQAKVIGGDIMEYKISKESVNKVSKLKIDPTSLSISSVALMRISHL